MNDGIGRLHLHLTWRYLAGFLALTLLCGTSHEFVHHFAGAAICGRFGVKTFNSFDLATGCDANPWSLLATVAGPAFTFALMWLGMAMLRSADSGRRMLGFALIFANFPINRMGFVLLGFNDEYWVARQLYGTGPVPYWLTVVLIWAICLPPLVAAWRAIGNHRRAAWFAGFFVLPFVFVMLFAGLFLEEYLLLRHHVLASRIIGVPWLILLVEVAALALYQAFKPDLTGAGRPVRLAPRAAML